MSTVVSPISSWRAENVWEMKTSPFTKVTLVKLWLNPKANRKILLGLCWVNQSDVNLHLMCCCSFRGAGGRTQETLDEASAGDAPERSRSSSAHRLQHRWLYTTVIWTLFYYLIHLLIINHWIKNKKCVCVCHSDTLMSSDEKRLTEEERDEERLEPRSDDEDT